MRKLTLVRHAATAWTGTGRARGAPDSFKGVRLRAFAARFSAFGLWRGADPNAEGRTPNACCLERDHDG
jgi:hypothetical protein